MGLEIKTAPVELNAEQIRRLLAMLASTTVRGGPTDHQAWLDLWRRLDQGHEQLEGVPVEQWRPPPAA